ncbi:MAG: DUF374 domain-containing protein [Planctomycetes bacterium]|nr:DUF374 domain-containing protein [Planctomycetota bacterium]
MKLRNPRLLKAVTTVGSRLVWAWMSTIRTTFDSQGQPTDPRKPKTRKPFIYTMWHENMLLVPTVKSTIPVTGLISHHRDGELIAQLGHYYGMGTIRGSSTRGGSEAIEEVLKIRDSSHLIILPDGPRGPRREVKRGLVYLSSWSQMPIVPIGVGFAACWRLKSWDRLCLPKPFSHIFCVAGPVIRVPERCGKKALESYHEKVQLAMDEASRVAEARARGERVIPNWPVPLERTAA